MMQVVCLILVVANWARVSDGQESLPKKWHGRWMGQMDLNKSAFGSEAANDLEEKIGITFEVQPIEASDALVWRMSFEGKPERTKDYQLVPAEGKGNYVIDEKGIELTAKHVNDTVYSQFAYEDMVLMARYELRGEKLLFEVTTAKPVGAKQMDKIQTYQVVAMQSVLMTRQPAKE